jgi:mono/diheme cytochrome c family protein
LLLLLVAAPGLGCWEQVSKEWFPQMKQQPAVQAFEDVAPLIPPEGTVPITGIAPRIDPVHPMPVESEIAKALPKPAEFAATAVSIERGQEVYRIYCSICHGLDGMANPVVNPVALALAQGGAPPFPLVAIGRFTDGQIFTKIRYGKPFMPAYPHITVEDRWHVVNYLRVLMKGG